MFYLHLLLLLNTFFYTGFDAFCGFMHMENAHTHPVVLSFISLVEAEIIEKKRAKKEQSVETIENGMYIVINSLYTKGATSEAVTPNSSGAPEVTPGF